MLILGPNCPPEFLGCTLKPQLSSWIPGEHPETPIVLLNSWGAPWNANCPPEFLVYTLKPLLSSWIPGVHPEIPAVLQRPWVLTLKFPSAHLKHWRSSRSWRLIWKSEGSPEKVQLSTGNPKWSPEVLKVYPMCRMLTGNLQGPPYCAIHSGRFR